MSQEYEKLVEEIAGIVGAGRYECEPEQDRDAGEYIISRILSAVVSGEQKLPGEAGRIGHEATGGEVLD